jgi:hypothetical protein
MSRPARIRTSLSALRHNYEPLRREHGQQVLAVLKADGLPENGPDRHARRCLRPCATAHRCVEMAKVHFRLCFPHSEVMGRFP